MPDFLLEIGTEEIPARMIQDASQELHKRLEDLLNKNALSCNEVKRAETPRRLTLIASGIPTTQPDEQEQLIGPATKVAYKDGQPTPAAHAFAKKAGVDVSKLQTVTTPKGEYLTATVTNKGKPAAQVLAELLPKEIASIYWPKNMYWRAGKPERFVRPVRWIVALLDGEIIPLEFGGIKAGKQSRGHRILGPQQVSIAAPSQYVATMQGAHVTALSADREYKIRKALDAATRTVPGARWREDADLLKTVVNLTEWPSAILGNFDKQYLSLPEEVLVTVMRDHQKYFAVEDAEHKLAPHFLAVLNTDGDPDGLIRHGNERVLRARFNDARFFWDTDQKISLEQRVKMLSAVTFQKDLGSYYDKTGRVQKLATDIALALGKAEFDVRGEMVADAARLSKTDLTTELVKEFTELQGIIGGLYARAQGLPQPVADAIYDQYKPESTEDAAPRTLEGAVLSIADKADSIAGMFALGLVPSGSKDPFALRRQANGIVKTIVEHKLTLNLAQIMADARSGYQASEAEKKFTLSGEAYVQAIRGFFRERLEFYLRDVLGLAYDVVNATLAAGADDVVDAVARALAVAKVRPSADFESISVAFKRMKNILRQAEEAKKKIAAPFNPAALTDEEEKKLAAAVPQIAKSVKELSASGQYEPALIEISRLRPTVDAFFDKVMVMVEDENLRAQRLGLLQTLVNEFSSIADFSEIVTEKK
ncbi:MAG: glycine--tRNA ligase subunit beta [Acidobacteriia bacterium]|nr:glycine--tRNA ligase subunit beta [Terriglobia bacterium]